MTQVASKKAPITKKPEKAISKEQSFVFGRENYIMMCIGIVILVIGFILMSGRTDVFNTTKLTVAPIVVMLGFIVEGFAVMYKSKS